MKFHIALLAALIAPIANADTLLAMQFNPNVRVVLSKQACDHKGFPGYIAVAQRIDNSYMRGCWTKEPTDKLVRVQWVFDKKLKDEPDSFSIFDADKFRPVEVN